MKKRFMSKPDVTDSGEGRVAYSNEYATPQIPEEQSDMAGVTLTAQNQERDAVIDKWQEDAANLAIAIPEFDFAKALQNEVFRRVLTSGGSVFEAYAEFAKMPKQPARNAILQNAQHSRRGTGDSVVNPARLSSADFKKYIDNIKGI